MTYQDQQGRVLQVGDGVRFADGVHGVVTHLGAQGHVGIDQLDGRYRVVRPDAVTKA